MDEPSVLQVVNSVRAGAEDVLSTGELVDDDSACGFKGSKSLLSISNLTHRDGLAGSIMFTTDQRTVLMRYFEEYGMTSTHRRNTELMQRCAQEVNTSIDRVKVRIAI